MANFKPNSQNLVAPRIHKTSLPGVYYLAHQIYSDERGYFAELGLIPDLEQIIGHPLPVKQVNLAHSLPNVVRGFHAEGWNKLVTLVRGTAFSALLDIRPDSATFGQVATFVLGDEPPALKGCLYIPMGVANSVCVTQGPVDYLYCVDRLYRDRDTQNDSPISLFDPDVKVTWPISREQMILSPRDRQADSLRSRFPAKFS